MCAFMLVVPGGWPGLSTEACLFVFARLVRWVCFSRAKEEASVVVDGVGNDCT